MSNALAAATIVAKHHLALARVIAQSFQQYHPDIPFFVLLADEIEEYFDPAAEDFHVITLEQLGKPALLPWCFRYAQLPLSYALTPILLQHLLGTFQRVIFIKQESLVLGRLDTMLDALQQASIVLTPHLLEPLRGNKRIDRELAILQAGTYNGGIIGLSADDNSRNFLTWWRERLTLNCRHDVAAGLHYEQRWLDLVPHIFNGVQVLRDPGCNVGHWHLPERSVRIAGKQVLVNDMPCGLFRFSGFEGAEPNQATRYFERLQLDQLGGAGKVFRHYHEQLLAAGHEQCLQWPYTWERFSNGVAISTPLRELYLAHGHNVEMLGDPFACSPDSFFVWLQRPARSECPELSRLWYSLYLRRADVIAAYPDPFGADIEGLLGWICNSGWREFAVDPALLPKARI